MSFAAEDEARKWEEVLQEHIEMAYHKVRYGPEGESKALEEEMDEIITESAVHDAPKPGGAGEQAGDMSVTIAAEAAAPVLLDKVKEDAQPSQEERESIFEALAPKSATSSNDSQERPPKGARTTGPG